MNSNKRFFLIVDVADSSCSTGLDQKTAGILAYLFGIVFIFIESENRFVRYCAVQSLFLWAAWMLLFIALSVFSAFPLIGMIFELVRALMSLIVLVTIAGLAVMAGKNKKVMFPFVSRYADEWSDPDL
ncbi:MAG: hypothetical protein JXX29_15530 [Deltaproteobacteria bacterium]|nr:hypothetical protein [Deltaproteobacteria bacterium]MBN2673091.1 hypothetical protein [Deltaproteobacteria bacterium]